MEQKHYFAFISYKREDEKWAKWLQNKLEHYRFPTNLNGRTDLPKSIRPTFRDVTDLTPGLLAEEIDNALRSSSWLIIICSPRSAHSPWVCKEAQTFIDLGLADHIIPFVIEGAPFSNDEATECYPEALLSLTGSKELLAANINEMGRDAAAIKVVARMFGLKFDALWQRHEREMRRRKWIWTGIISFLIIVILGVAAYVWHLYQDARRNESLYLAEEAQAMINKGDYEEAISKLKVALPRSSSPLDRPYVPKAERVLRSALFVKCEYLQRSSSTGYSSIAVSPDSIHFAIGTNHGQVLIYDCRTMALTDSLCIPSASGGKVFALEYNSDGSKIVVGTLASGILCIFDTKTGEIIAQNDRYHGSSIYCAIFAPDDKVVFTKNYGYVPRNMANLSSISQDYYCKIIEWDPGKDTDRVITCSPQIYSGVSLSSRGTFLVAALKDGTIQEWDYRNLKMLRQFVDPSNMVNSIHFCKGNDNYYITANGAGDATIWRPKQEHSYLSVSTNSGSLVSASIGFRNGAPIIIANAQDGSVIVWEIASPGQSMDKQKRRVMNGHRGTVIDSKILPDNRIVSVSWDGTARIWNPWNDYPEHIIDTSTVSGHQSILARSWLGKYELIQKDTAAIVWDKWNNRLSTVIPTRKAKWGCFTTDPRTVLVSNSQVLGLYDIKSGRLIQRQRHTRIPTAFYNPLSSIVYYCGYREFVAWHLTTARTDTLARIDDLIEDARFIKNGKYAEITTRDSVITIRTRDGNTVKSVLINHDYGSYCNSSDGRLYAVLSNNRIAVYSRNHSNELVWEAYCPTLAKETFYSYEDSFRFGEDDQSLLYFISNNEYYKWDFPSLKKILDQY